MAERSPQSYVCLPEFRLGGRPTKVVREGDEFAAVYADTGEMIGVPFAHVETAAEKARIAAMPAGDDWAEEDEQEGYGCCGGHSCARCCGVPGWLG